MVFISFLCAGCRKKCCFWMQGNGEVLNFLWLLSRFQRLWYLVAFAFIEIRLGRSAAILNSCLSHRPCHLHRCVPVHTIKLQKMAENFNYKKRLSAHLDCNIPKANRHQREDQDGPKMENMQIRPICTYSRTAQHSTDTINLSWQFTIGELPNGN